jgi:hypothetical protein
MAPTVFAPVRGLPGRFPVGARRALDAMSRHFGVQYVFGLGPASMAELHCRHAPRTEAACLRVALIGAGSLLMEGPPPLWSAREG